MNHTRNFNEIPGYWAFRAYQRLVQSCEFQAVYRLVRRKAALAKLFGNNYPEVIPAASGPVIKMQLTGSVNQPYLWTECASDRN